MTSRTTLRRFGRFWVSAQSGGGGTQAARYPLAPYAIVRAGDRFRREADVGVSRPAPSTKVLLPMKSDTPLRPMRGTAESYPARTARCRAAISRRRSGFE